MERECWQKQNDINLFSREGVRGKRGSAGSNENYINLFSKEGGWELKMSVRSNGKKWISDCFHKMESVVGEGVLAETKL